MSRALILLGGGLDSAALLPFYLDQEFEVSGIHFDYGQPAAAPEQRAATNLSKHYGVPLETAKLTPIPRIGDEFTFRNGTLILEAARRLSAGIVAIGVHDGTPYYDCSADFLSKISDIVSNGSGGKLRLDAPWKTGMKADVLAFARNWSVPISLTYSCQTGTTTPCGTCRSCHDREQLECR